MIPITSYLTREGLDIESAEVLGLTTYFFDDHFSALEVIDVYDWLFTCGVESCGEESSRIFVAVESKVATGVCESHGRYETPEAAEETQQLVERLIHVDHQVREGITTADKLHLVCLGSYAAEAEWTPLQWVDGQA